MLEVLLGSVEPRLNDFGSEELAMTAWSGAKVRVAEASVEAVAEAAGHRLQEFSLQELGNMAWCC